MLRYERMKWLLGVFFCLVIGTGCSTVKSSSTTNSSKTIDSGFSSSAGEYDSWPKVSDTVASIKNPPDFGARLTIREIKIPVPTGFWVLPFEYNDKWFNAQFPNQGFPYRIIFDQGHYAAVFASSTNEFVFMHDGKLLYRGYETVRDFRLLDGGSKVVFTTTTQFPVVDAKKEKEKYINASGWESTAVNRDVFLKSQPRCPATLADLAENKIQDCSDSYLLYEAPDCSHRLIVVKSLLYRYEGKKLINNPCSRDYAIDYRWDGQRVFSFPFPNKAEVPLDYAPLLFDTGNYNNYAVSPDGLRYVVGPLRRIAVGNSGAWVALDGPFYVVNGKRLSFDERLGSGATALYINTEGSGYVIEGARGFLTNDGQFFHKDNGDFLGPAAKIQIISSTVYHYSFNVK